METPFCIQSFSIYLWNLFKSRSVRCVRGNDRLKRSRNWAGLKMPPSHTCPLDMFWQTPVSLSSPAWARPWLQAPTLIKRPGPRSWGQWGGEEEDAKRRMTAPRGGDHEAATGSFSRHSVSGPETSGSGNTGELSNFSKICILRVRITFLVTEEDIFSCFSDDG